MKDNSTIRKEALASLKGNWFNAILVVLAYTVISSVSSIPYIGFLGYFLLVVPIMYSMYIVYLKVARGEAFEVSNLFDAFKNYSNVLSTMLYMILITFLWSLLLIVPGIIKGYAYSMVPYILSDTGKTGKEALQESQQMMEGNKMRLFLMDLGFLGLVILSMLTFGIALFWVAPYWYTSRAKFYLSLKA